MEDDILHFPEGVHENDVTLFSAVGPVSGLFIGASGMESAGRRSSYGTRTNAGLTAI
jgi:hypothetical protein